MEGFRDVIVGTQVQAFDFVRLIVLARQHDHEPGFEFGPRLELLRQHHAVHVGQTAIEYREVPWDLQELFARLVAGRKLDAVVAAALQKQANQPANRSIIVDDDNLKLLLLGHDALSRKADAIVRHQASDVRR